MQRIEAHTHMYTRRQTDMVCETVQCHYSGNRIKLVFGEGKMSKNGNTQRIKIYILCFSRWKHYIRSVCTTELKPLTYTQVPSDGCILVRLTRNTCKICLALSMHPFLFFFSLFFSILLNKCTQLFMRTHNRTPKCN